MSVRFLVLRLSMLVLPLGGATLLLSSAPAMAQFSDSYNFLKAVRDRDGNKATDLLNDETTRVVNTRDGNTGETALSIVVQRRDVTWTSFLLSKGGDPSIADKNGMTPLMHATLLGFTEGAELLIAGGAAVDQSNRRGETALILAVQAKSSNMVRLLISNGANPDTTDHVAGLSARDYARRDDRTGQMLTLLDAKPDKQSASTGPVFGPK